MLSCDLLMYEGLSHSNKYTFYGKIIYLASHTRPERNLDSAHKYHGE